MLHDPQCEVDVSLSTQDPPHISRRPEHFVEHFPALQTSPGAHAERHAPQFVALSCVFVSHPFSTLPSQDAQPFSQVPTAQLPLLHTGVLRTEAQGEQESPPHP